ncbi:hypothetical protein CLI64_23695 [Nostoc sp. CENA543]|uniref:transglutaminase domain-containing protein n=1 Tax=Nostoc sp. CENA543 TaxID=1869241 RepID=UPI000CA3267A|nr:transglutaminase domain-containing protein [Nostoc sp. CENA543]AUT03171.1 hypothetical protein CLI64_23695 [Nostoc sp. CENA543]
MPDNLEASFFKEVRKLKQKQRKLLMWRVGLILLLLILVSGLAYSCYQGASILLTGNLITGISILIFSVLGLVLVVRLLIFLIKNRQILEYSNHPLLTSISWQFSRLKQVKRKYVLGWGLLLIALIYQSNPSFIHQPINNFIDFVVHKPAPPTLNSPWPWKDHEAIHPVVANMPANIETTIESVARYIAQNESDPYLRIKAIHDYVVSRVTYDLDVLKTGIRPSQDAQTVFRTHKAVCEGYANLFMALGQSMGVDVVYISGKIRRDLAPIDLIPKLFRLLNSDYDWTNHAWNAVKILDNWQLVDTTWDDGNSSEFGSSYSTNYLMIPPQVMSISHFPKHLNWQLLQHLEDYNTFENKPVITPQFAIDKLTLVSPTEYQTKVQKSAEIKIATYPSYQKRIVALFTKVQTTESSSWDLPSSGDFLESDKNQQIKQQDIGRCRSQINAAKETQISCQFPNTGDYQVFLFSLEGKANVDFLGQLKFQVLGS